MPCPPIPYASTNGSSYGSITNSAIPFQWNTKVRIHHNMIYNNASIGDALFSGTPSGAGAITISAGADDYQIDHNWIAGNMSIGRRRWRSAPGPELSTATSTTTTSCSTRRTNPTLPTNGGGLIIEGANLDRTLTGQECGSINDQDCPPGLGEGVGYSTVIDSNLILGNSAESGSGGGVRIQQVNGTELLAFPAGPDPHGNPNATPGWFDVTMTNNIIVNNVAGWDGGGVSLQDALKVTFINNTVASNDTTASAGSLFKTLGAVTAASAPPGCDAQTDPTLPQDPSCTGNSAQHGPQPAGLVVMENTPNLITAINDLGGGATGAVRCPANFGYTDGTAAPRPIGTTAAGCRSRRMANDLFWQNRYFSVNIIGLGSGTQSQQNLVALTPQLNQTSTGACSANNNYWDIGLRTDDVASGAISRLNNSLTLDQFDLLGQQLCGRCDGFVIESGDQHRQHRRWRHARGRAVLQRCARAAGELRGADGPHPAGELPRLQHAGRRLGDHGPESVVPVQRHPDDGHDRRGPELAEPGLRPADPEQAHCSELTNAEMMIASRVAGTAQGAYSIPASSSAINKGTNGSVGTNTALPGTTASDFFGNARLRNVANPTDIGAVEYGSSGGATGATVAPASLSFGNQPVGQASAAQTLTLTAGSTAMTGISVTGIAAPFSQSGGHLHHHAWQRTRRARSPSCSRRRRQGQLRDRSR